MTISYLSVCDGISAWSVATEGLPYTCVARSEIDAFASAVLAERFGANLPDEPWSGNSAPNVGDFTTLLDESVRARLPAPIDLLVGGTPCQAFSFAGKRLSLADTRGNLTLAFAVLCHELVRSHDLRSAVWENVPGCLSTDDNAFGCFLGALVGADDALLPSPKPAGRRGNELWTFSAKLDDIRPAWPDEGMVEGARARAAWRVLDAQYFGLAQRRERVLLVVDFGNGADPAAVLFEPQGLQGNSPPRREAGQRAAATVTASTGGCSGKDGIDGRLAYGGGNRSGPVDVAATLTAKGRRIDFEVETFIAGPAHTLRGEGFDASEDGTGRGTPLVPVVLRGHSDYGDGLPCLRAEGGDAGGGSEALVPTAYRTSGNSGAWATGDKVDALTTGTDRTSHIVCVHADALSRSGDNRTTSADAAGHVRLRPAGMGVIEDGTSFAVATGQPHAVAYSIMPQNSGKDYKAREVEVAQPLMAGGPVGGNQGGDFILQHWAVRRLTPVECARLQGFPDHHSRIAWRGKPAELCPDGPQYKGYGNSMATKKMRWLAIRLAAAMPVRAA